MEGKEVEELGGEGREGKKGRGRGGGAIQCLASGRHRLSCATAFHTLLLVIHSWLFVARFQFVRFLVERCIFAMEMFTVSRKTRLEKRANCAKH